MLQWPAARYGLGFLPNLMLFVLSITFLRALPTVPSSASGFASGALEDDPKLNNVGVGALLLLDGVGAVIVIGTG